MHWVLHVISDDHNRARHAAAVDLLPTPAAQHTNIKMFSATHNMESNSVDIAAIYHVIGAMQLGCTRDAS